MTAQTHDRILIGDKEYSIVGVNGGELFTPQSVGIEPVAVLSSCWRGYICRYKIVDNILVLDELRLSFGAWDMSEGKRKFVERVAPPINGVNPVRKYPGFNNLYEGVNLHIPFTGGILAGDGFIEALYIHMGFHPAWKYQTVLELIFGGGNVQEIRDVSIEIEKIRDRMIRLPLEPGIGADEKEVEEWIERTFRLDYDLRP